MHFANKTLPRALPKEGACELQQRMQKILLEAQWGQGVKMSAPAVVWRDGLRPVSSVGCCV